MIVFLHKVINKIKDGYIKEMFIEGKWILKYVKLYRKSVIFYILLGILGTAMSFASSVASKYLIDAITGYDLSNTTFIVVTIIFMGVGSIATTAFSSRISAKINLRVDKEIQCMVYDNIMTSDWEELNYYRTGDLLNRLTGDVSTVSTAVLGWIPNLITRLVQFIGAFSIIIYYDYTMAVIPLISAPISIILSKHLLNKMKSYNVKMRNVSSEVMAFNDESFQNLLSIKALGLCDYFTNKLRAVQCKYIDTSLEYNKFSVYTSAFMSLIGMVIAYMCFGWGAYRLWSGIITFGTMILFLQLSSSLSSSFNSLLSLIPSAVSATTSAGRIMELTTLPHETIKTDSALHKLIKKQSHGITIEIRNLTFKYKNSRNILVNVNIYAKPGEVGPSGQGKTTLLSILLGVIKPPPATAILKNYQGIICEASAATRPLFSYVPQSNTMFCGTIAENLRLVNPAATDDDIINALNITCAYEFVSKLPKGIHSIIGEKGCGLSVGQNQRLAIARAILKDSPILLLDEATSALDVETEERVLRNIMAVYQNRTCIVATHRPSVLKLCNRIYKVENKCITQI